MESTRSVLNKDSIRVTRFCLPEQTIQSFPSNFMQVQWLLHFACKVMTLDLLQVSVPKQPNILQFHKRNIWHWQCHWKDNFPVFSTLHTGVRMPPGNVPMSMLPRSQFRPCGLSQRQSRLQPGSRWTDSSDGPEVTGLKQARWRMPKKLPKNCLLKSRSNQGISSSKRAETLRNIQTKLLATGRAPMTRLDKASAFCRYRHRDRIGEGQGGNVVTDLLSNMKWKVRSCATSSPYCPSDGRPSSRFAGSKRSSHEIVMYGMGGRQVGGNDALKSPNRFPAVSSM